MNSQKNCMRDRRRNNGECVGPEKRYYRILKYQGRKRRIAGYPQIVPPYESSPPPPPLWWLEALNGVDFEPPYAPSSPPLWWLEAVDGVDREEFPRGVAI